MKQLTRDEALNEVFNTSPITPRIAVHKFRHSQGKLSQKAIDEILKDNNFVVVQETLYIKK